MLSHLVGKLILLWAYLRTRCFRRFESRAELEAWQQERVERLLAWVLPRSRYYRERMGDRPLSQWRDLPVTDKATMMANFDALNTAGLIKAECLAVAHRAEHTRDFTPGVGKFTVGLSAGTSGNKGLFAAGPSERFQWAGTILAKTLPGSILGRHRIALFLRSGSNLYDTVGGWSIKFAYFDLFTSLQDNLAALDAFAPTVLVAPPSMLRFVAQAKKNGQLRIVPRKIISVAEVLDPLDERFVSRVFGQPIHQIYQATEGFLAATCSHGTLHLNEDVMVIERDYLDEAAGKFVPIITDFRRVTQPIIRYRLDDILTERKTPCPCGALTTAIESIDGRCDDIFYFERLGGRLPFVAVFPDLIRRVVLTASATIDAYVVRQLSPLEVEIQVLCRGGGGTERKAVEKSLARLCSRLQCTQPKVTFAPYTHKPGPRKFKRVQRSFDPAQAMAEAQGASMWPFAAHM